MKVLQTLPIAALFQFTHPRGVRSQMKRIRTARNGFNSRTREGCDFLDAQHVQCIHVSIHAPARGAIR